MWLLLDDVSLRLFVPFTSPQSNTFSMKYLSKTNYLEYLFCPKNLWLKINAPELLEDFELSDFEKSIIEKGNEVEEWARKLFPDGVLVDGKNLEEKAIETKKLMDKKVPVLFQATFIADGFVVMADILEYDPKKNVWNLYEVKGTNSLKETSSSKSHIDDVAFQNIVLQSAKIPMGKLCIMHLNKDYKKQGDITLDKLFIVNDVGDKIKEIHDATKTTMSEALAYILKKGEPKGNCSCLYKGRNQHCPTFSYSNKKVPGYSVHDLSRIGSSKRKLKDLIDRNIYDVADIPLDMEFSPVQQNQIDVFRTGKPMINSGEIKAELESLEFPLYFLDYETYSPAIPLYDNYRPYQHVPFQFSLHVLDSPGGELRHIEFLHEEDSNPSVDFAEFLIKHIKDAGTVIVWHKVFECGRNKDLGEMHLEHKAFFERLNNQIYDLKDIFQKQHYVHSDFRGSISIKKVLPVLVPELHYKDLNIQEGGAAMEKWRSMISNKTLPDEKKKISADLLEYCKRDTYAMYAIWKVLNELIS